MPTEATVDLRVLILAPIGRDGALTSQLLTNAGVPCHVCAGARELCQEIRKGAGAVLLTEEALADQHIDELAATLQTQPAWSDVSLLLFAGDDRSQATIRTLRTLEVMRNVTLLDRPIRVTAVISTVRAALRGRRRQYELRDVLAALESSRQDAERARDDAERANRLKDEFLATLSHELRTPLNAILGWVSLLRDRRVEAARIPKVLEIVARNAQSQAQLISDVLDVSRVITGRLRLRLQPVVISRILRDAMDTVRPAADAKEITLDLTVSGEPPRMNGDAERLRQVFWNLLSNAVKFTPAGGRVRGPDRSRRFADPRHHLGQRRRHPARVPALRVRALPPGRPELHPAARRARPGPGHRQAPRRDARRRGVGRQRRTGDGHHVHRAAADRRRAGARRRRAGIGRGGRTKTAGPRSAPPSSARPCSSSTTTPTTRDLLATLLTERGARVATADSAAAAIEWLETEVPSVIIADVGMPGQDGLSMMRVIRRRPPHKGGAVPSIALSAFARAEDRRAALSAGFDEYLTKPALPADVLGAVARVLASRAAAARHQVHRRARVAAGYAGPFRGGLLGQLDAAAAPGPSTDRRPRRAAPPSSAG